MSSILNTVKEGVGLDISNTDFDAVLVDITNGVIFIMAQMGIGPENGFTITGSLETWESFLQDALILSCAKTYVPLKVKEIFDPPSSSVLGQALAKRIEELEVRMKTQSDYLKSLQ